MFEIEVLPKKGLGTERGESVLSDIASVGIKGVQKVECSKVYKVEGDLSSDDVKMLCSEVLSDKISETFKVKKNNAEQKEKAIVIEVWFKKGVTDSAAENIIKAANDLGIKKNISAKSGQKYYLYGKLSKSVLETIAAGLLANTLIQEYKIK